MGKRVDAGGAIAVGKLQVYSLAPLHSLGSERLHRDARLLDKALAERFSAEKTETVVADVDALVHRHRLAVEVTLAGSEGLSRRTALPERELLEAHRPEEQAVGATHRLVILPLRLTLDRSTGVAHGVLRWRVEGTANDETLAVGLLRYTADARGYPAKRMASMLVAKLRALNIR
ncbi:hypothetical protein ACQKIE_08050 [Luteibacter sp. NPDC031894]|uniref:hypothetical protein n=1 Tax=Luteibacter sp. NPDC031894 TaxID=3390572 RepID=UPI003D04F7DC